MTTVTLLSRDPLVTARLRRLLNGTLDLRPADSLSAALDPSATGLTDILLVDFGTSHPDPDAVAAFTARPARPFLVGLVATGEEAPGFTLPKLGASGSVSLGDLKGKVMLLNFWHSK